MVGVTAKNDAFLTMILITVTFVVLTGASAFFLKKNAYVRHVDAGFTIAMVAVMIISQGIF